MPHYFLEMTHTDKECLRALDEIAAFSLQLLNYSWFACKGSVHTGWVSLEADSEAAARNMLPPSARPHARVTEVQKYTAEQIRQFHQKRG